MVCWAVASLALHHHLAGSSLPPGLPRPRQASPPALRPPPCWEPARGAAVARGMDSLLSDREGRPPASALRRCWDAYLRAIRSAPLLTKSLTCAALAALGDALAQVTTAVAVAGPGGLAFRTLPAQFELGRLVRFAAVNGVLTAPTFHFWYGWLDAKMPGNGLRGAAVRTVPDQLLFSPLFLFVFLTAVRSASASPIAWQPPARALWWTANCVNWSVLPVTQFINFWLVPEPFQVLFSNVVAVGMNAVMSYLTARG